MTAATLYRCPSCGTATETAVHPCGAFAGSTVPAVEVPGVDGYDDGSGSRWVTSNKNSGTGYTAGSGTGYTAGDVAETPRSGAPAPSFVTFSSSGTPSWTPLTITTYGCLVHDSTAWVGLSFHSFGGVQTVTAGTFNIVWNGSGIAAFTC